MTLARVPNVKPITIGHYTLTATGITVKGKPTLAEHEGVGDFVQRARNASGFWIADLLAYAKSRGDWTEQLSQVASYTGLSEKTVRNISRLHAIEPSRRREDLEEGHHEAVVALPPTEQSRWLENAASEGWTVSEMRQEMRAAKRKRVIDTKPVMTGLYRVVYAAPKWTDIAAVRDLPIKAKSYEQAVLFLWVPPSMILANPGPRDVLESWGFTAQTNLAWDKVLKGIGRFVDVRHEHLVIATRGECLPDRPTPSFDSVLTERQDSESFEKPAGVRKMIERLYDGPRLLVNVPEAEGWDTL